MSEPLKLETGKTTLEYEVLDDWSDVWDDVPGDRTSCKNCLGEIRQDHLGNGQAESICAQLRSSGYVFANQEITGERKG